MGLVILNPEDEGQASGVKRFDEALDGLLDPEGILDFMRDFASRKVVPHAIASTDGRPRKEALATLS